MISKEAASVLRALRNNSGFTQKKVSELTGIKCSRISELERELTSFTVEEARILGKFLNDEYELLLWIVRGQKKE